MEKRNDIKWEEARIINSWRVDFPMMFRKQHASTKDGPARKEEKGSRFRPYAARNWGVGVKFVSVVIFAVSLASASAFFGYGCKNNSASKGAAKSGNVTGQEKAKEEVKEGWGKYLETKPHSAEFMPYNRFEGKKVKLPLDMIFGVAEHGVRGAAPPSQKRFEGVEVKGGWIELKEMKPDIARMALYKRFERKEVKEGWGKAREMRPNVAKLPLYNGVQGPPKIVFEPEEGKEIKAASPSQMMFEGEKVKEGWGRCLDTKPHPAEFAPYNRFEGEIKSESTVAPCSSSIGAKADTSDAKKKHKKHLKELPPLEVGPPFFGDLNITPPSQKR